MLSARVRCWAPSMPPGSASWSIHRCTERTSNGIRAASSRSRTARLTYAPEDSVTGKPEYYLRRELNIAYDPSKEAPSAVAFLNSLFADRDQATRNEIVGLLQEFCGASLAVRLLRREQRRALILIGPSRTGKTELARLIGRLVGN